jgi:hypothetical protein
MSRVLQDILVMFQRFPLDTGGSVRHVCDMANDPNNMKPLRMLLTFPPEVWERLDPEQRAAFIRLWQRKLRSFSPKEWERLPPPVRDAYNRLRQLRSLLPLPPPPADLSPKPYVPPTRLLDPSPLARAVARADNPEEQEALWRELVIETDALLAAHDGDRYLLAERLRRGTVTSKERELAAELYSEGKKRAAHRPTTLDRELREDMAKSYLRVWYWLEPHQRISQGEVIYWIKQNCRISRAEAFELLKQIKAETVEHAELVDGAGVEPAAAMCTSVGLLIRRGQDHQRLRRWRKASKARATESG